MSKWNESYFREKENILSKNWRGAEKVFSISGNYQFHPAWSGVKTGVSLLTMKLNK